MSASQDVSQWCLIIIHEKTLSHYYSWHHATFLYDRHLKQWADTIVEHGAQVFAFAWHAILTERQAFNQWLTLEIFMCNYHLISMKQDAVSSQTPSGFTLLFYPYFWTVVHITAFSYSSSELQHAIKVKWNWLQLISPHFCYENRLMLKCKFKKTTNQWTILHLCIMSSRGSLTSLWKISWSQRQPVSAQPRSQRPAWRHSYSISDLHQDTEKHRHKQRQSDTWNFQLWIKHEIKIDHFIDMILVL